MQMVRQAERQTGNLGRLNHTVKLERGPDPILSASSSLEHGAFIDSTEIQSQLSTMHLEGFGLV